MKKSIQNAIEKVSGATNMYRRSIQEQLDRENVIDKKLQKAKNKLATLKSPKVKKKQEGVIEALRQQKKQQAINSKRIIKAIIKTSGKVESTGQGGKMIPTVCSDGGSTAQSWKHKVYKHKSQKRPNINKEQGSFAAGILGSSICKAPEQWFKVGGIIKMARQPKSLRDVTVIKNPFKSSSVSYIAIRMDADMKPIQGVKIYGFDSKKKADAYAEAIRKYLSK